mmetsp:Transcript_32495/g.66596  ORF Transcript_32495/g.66596 Transcript_32495/m.66596 type:complete len:361 (+) Transcript_32495:67-1149(+)
MMGRLLLLPFFRLNIVYGLITIIVCGQNQRRTTAFSFRASKSPVQWMNSNANFPLNAVKNQDDFNSPYINKDIKTRENFLERRRFLNNITSASLFTSLVSTTPLKAKAATRDPKTGILLPSPGEIESSIPTSWDENDNPFDSFSKESFSRLDSSPDTFFYSDPRFVEHVDEQAVESMTKYISNRLLLPGDSVLDLCSSWTSHISRSRLEELKLKRVAGLGMNAKELEANNALTEWAVKDLNEDKNVKLPYDNESFDVVMCQLSVDYLIHPLEVMREASRVLKSGGKIAIIFSNRLFLSKAVGLWTGSDDIEHAYTVGCYLHYCNGGFKDIKAKDLSTRKQKGNERVIVGDPLYVVTAVKT